MKPNRTRVLLPPRYFYKRCKPLAIALCFCYLLDFMMDVLWLWDLKTARASDKSVKAQGSNLAVGKILMEANSLHQE